MADIYHGPTKVKRTAAERRVIMASAAHLLNKLRDTSCTFSEKWTAQDENTFWAFIGLLHKDDQTSVIN